MDKYKKLVSNTLIFAVGTFSSKVLVFLLMPLYTRVLSTEEYLSLIHICSGISIIRIWMATATASACGL